MQTSFTRYLPYYSTINFIFLIILTLQSSFLSQASDGVGDGENPPVILTLSPSLVLVIVIIIVLVLSRVLLVCAVIVVLVVVIVVVVVFITVVP